MPELERGEILLADIRHVDTAVILERAHGGDDHCA